MFDPMISADETGALNAKGIIRQWRANAAGDQMTLFVRPGVRFHNGDEVTADDIKFSFETWMRPGAPNTGSFFRGAIEKIEPVDKYTVRVRLKNPNAIFAYVTSWMEGDIAVIPKRYYESLPGATNEEKDAEFVKRPIGTGPYRFVRRSIGTSIEFEANMNYWDSDRAPRFRRLVLLKVPETTTRVNMLRTNAADLIDVPAEQAVELRRDGFKLFVQKNVAHAVLMFYMSHDPRFITHDLRIRKALITAVDRTAIAKAMFPNISGVGPAGIVANAPPLAGPGIAGYRPDLPSYPYDPQEARQLLEDAGYFKEPKTITAFSFTFVSVPEGPKMLEAVAEYWKAVGVKVEIRQVDWPLISQRLIAWPQGFDPPAAVGIQAPVYRPSGLGNLIVFATSKKYGALNIYPDLDKADKLYLDAVRTMSPHRYEEMLYQLWKTTAEDYWALPLVWRHALWAANPKTLAEWRPVNLTGLYLRYETAVPAAGVR